MNLLATLERLFFILDSPLGFDEFFCNHGFFLVFISVSGQVDASARLIHGRGHSRVIGVILILILVAVFRLIRTETGFGIRIRLVPFRSPAAGLPPLLLSLFFGLCVSGQGLKSWTGTPVSRPLR